MTEEEYRNLPPGWSSKDGVDALKLLAQSAFETVIELGSYVGRSATILAKYSGQVHCVDTWSGRFVTEEGIKLSGLAHKSEIHQAFLNNTKSLPNVTSEKTNFEKFMGYSSRRADLIFIDAGPQSTLIDRLLDYAWVHSNKCIAGYHYYSDYRNVSDQVDDFASRHGLVVQVDRCLWKITKE